MSGKRAKLWESGLGTGADTTVIILRSLVGIDRLVVETLTGSVRAHASLDGNTFPGNQLVFSLEPAVAGDAVTEPEGSFVAVTSVARLAVLFGRYQAIRFQQVGATAASIRVLGTGDA